jgi:hypothetical protein
MTKPDLPLDRLLRAAAAAAPRVLPNDMPFGFDTRVLASWRAELKSDLVDFGRLLRRVVLLSLGVIALATAGVYHDLSQSEELGDAPGDEYAIADSAIGNALGP